MRYGRDYGRRGGFVSRAVDTVRDWAGGDPHHGYDRGYRQMGAMDRGYTPRRGAWNVGPDDRGMRGGDYGHYGSRDFMTNRGYDRPDMGPGMQRGGFRGGWAGDADRTVEYGRGREWHPQMRRGGGMPRGYDRDVNRGGWNAGGPWAAELQDDDLGGTIGAYGPYSNYGIPRFRSNNSGGMNPGQYFNGYGIGSGYRYGG